MTFETNQNAQITFGSFCLDVRAKALYRDGRTVTLGGRSLDILCALAELRGNLVSKDQLAKKVWAGAIVEDNTIQAHISALRKALESGQGGPRYIQTVPGRGYRLLAESSLAPHSSDLSKPSIAVLPFQNMSGDPEQDYFADGIVEDIITALTRVPALLVIARNSSFVYKGRSVDVRQVGRELGVRYLLEGSVRKAGDRLRMTGQLVQAGTGVHLWAQQFDGSLADIFALQDEITASVVGALVPTLQGAEIARARRKPPDSLDAYDLYLRALAARATLTREGADEALRLLDRAMALDPTFVAAATLAGITWAIHISQGWSSLEMAQKKALHYGRLAVELDPHDAEALATLARWTAMCTRDYAEARLLAERAIALDPHSARVWRSSGYIHVYMGAAELALDHLQRGLRFHPRDPWVHDSWGGVAIALMHLGRDEEAVAAARTAVHLNPRFAASSRILAAALALIGHVDEANDTMRQHSEIDPSCTIAAIKDRFGHSEKRSPRYFEGMRKAGMPE